MISSISFPLLNSSIFFMLLSFFCFKFSIVSLFILISVFNEDKVDFKSVNFEINAFFSA